MGMFDSLYSSKESAAEWQTKAYGCCLDRFYVGDEMPRTEFDVDTYQVEVLGGGPEAPFTAAYATVLHGRLVSVGDSERLPRLPLMHRFGGLVEAGWESESPDA